MENIEKFYVEYGKFIIHFEVINFQLCYNIRKHCTNDKMFSEEDKRIDILLEGLTSNPLLSKFKSIFLTTELSKDLELKKLVDKFVKNFTKAIEYRNFIAHGTFFAGDALGNTNNFEIRKPKLTSQGYKQNVNVISLKSLKKLNVEIQKLEIFISNLNFYRGEKIPKINERFIFEEMKISMDEVNVYLDILNVSMEY